MCPKCVYHNSLSQSAGLGNEYYTVSGDRNNFGSQMKNNLNKYMDLIQCTNLQPFCHKETGYTRSFTTNRFILEVG